MPRAPAQPGPRTPRGTPLADLPSQGWDTWWRWNRLEFLFPEHRPQRDVQDRARSQLSSRLIAAASGSNATVRAAAVRALGRVVGAGAVPHLLARLQDPVREVREDAILALGTTGRASAVHALLHIARQGSLPGHQEKAIGNRSQSRALAVIALGLCRRYGSRLVLDRVVRDLPVRVGNRKTRPAEHESRDLALAKLLYATLVASSEMHELSRQLADARQTSLELRCRALASLNGARDDASLEVLVGNTASSRLEARRAAALTLGVLRHRRAVPAMVAAQRREREHLTRGFLLVAIGRQGGDEARDLLLRSIRTGPKTLRPWAALGLGLLARQQGAEADGGLPDAEVLEALRRAHRAEKNRHASGAYLIALGLARDAAAFAELDRKLHEARSAVTRIAAAEALALLGRHVARTPILTSLSLDPDHAIRAALAEILGYVGQPRDHEVLISLLRDATPAEMAPIGRGIGLLASPESYLPLYKIADEPGASAIVRATAIEALALMFARHRGLNLNELARNANFATFGGWVSRIFHLNL